jgi:protein tyrosine phosphatase
MSTGSITFEKFTEPNGLSLYLEQSNVAQRMYAALNSSITPQTDDTPQPIIRGNNTSFDYLDGLTQEILVKINRQKVSHLQGRDRYPGARPFTYNQVKGTNGSWIAFPKKDHYVEHLHPEAPFIATCAPVRSQFGTFMDMLIRYNCELLVTLTDPVEDEEVKADVYLPEYTKMMFIWQAYTVDCLKNKTLATLENGWMIQSRKYHLQLLNDKNVSFYFENLHVSNWKDGTEGAPHAILDLVKTVYEHKRLLNSTAPIVAHCSMGVGRTGVFIGCYRIYQRALEEGKILTDRQIFKIASQMRLQRIGLGGGEKQYQMLFLFRDLLASRPELNKPINTQAN